MEKNDKENNKKSNKNQSFFDNMKKFCNKFFFKKIIQLSHNFCRQK